MSGKYGVAELQRLLTSQNPWKPFPSVGERGEWARSDQKMMKATYEEALKYLEFEWPSIPATTTLLFVRTGDRDEYQGLSFRKRTVLGTLLLAEIHENKGRFLDQIIRNSGPGAEKNPTERSVASTSSATSLNSFSMKSLPKHPKGCHCHQKSGFLIWRCW